MDDMRKQKNLCDCVAFKVRQSGHLDFCHWYDEGLVWLVTVDEKGIAWTWCLS